MSGLDLATEEGRQLYVELLKLGPAFAALFAGLEAFNEWLTPADQTAAALDRLRAVFSDFGLGLPNTRAELEDLVAAGGLTQEQMAILAGYLDDLKRVFDDLGDNVDDLTEKYAAQRDGLRDLADQLDPADPLSAAQRQQALDALRNAGYTGDLYDAQGIAAFLRGLAELDEAGGDAGKKLLEFADTFTGVFDEIARIAQERSDLTLRLLELQGDDEAILAERRRRELESVDEANRDLLRRIYLLEDEQRALETLKGDQRQLTEDAYQQRVDAINAEREALDASHQAQLDALAAQRDAAAEALTAAQGLLSSITSAISGLRGQLVDEFSSARASQQLANWAGAGTLPDQESLDRTLGAIGKDKANYATAAAYELASKRDLANLLKLQDLKSRPSCWISSTKSRCKPWKTSYSRPKTGAMRNWSGSTPSSWPAWRVSTS